MFIDTQERPAGEVQQKVGRIKLSEAIRIGVKLRPKCTGGWFRDGGSCAMGAMYEGYFGRSFTEKFPTGAARKQVNEHFAPIMYSDLYQIIGQKNDSGESRESIATWLEAQGL